jgi:AAA family ATP:ADP antiporter
MVSMIMRTLWGDISREEFKKFGLLSSVFFFIIGAYWMLRLMKNALFTHIIGSSGLPYAKIISIVSLLLIVLFYNKLVDWLEKTKLVYLLATFYGLLFLSFAYFLTHPTIGMPNSVADKSRIFGWVIYIAIESFGSLVIAAFWSFVASVMDTASAKKGYPVIVSGAQLGSITGSVLVMLLSTRLGMPALMCIATVSVLIVPFMIRIFAHHYESIPSPQAVEKKQATGVLEGLKLIASRPYLMGVLVVSTVYEIISTVFDILQTTSAKATFGSTEKVAEFLGMYGLATNTLSFLFALIGTSYFIRRLGLTACLVTYPLMVACLVGAVWIHPVLWTFFAAQVIMKGMSYALNNPCKEIMYIPTSKDVKFKAKSWIDVQGSRSAKALGAGIVALSPLIAFSSVISLGIIGLWIPVALFVGRTNSTLVRDGNIIE